MSFNFDFNPGIIFPRGVHEKCDTFQCVGSNTTSTSCLNPSRNYSKYKNPVRVQSRHTDDLKRYLCFACILLGISLNLKNPSLKTPEKNEKVLSKSKF